MAISNLQLIGKVFNVLLDLLTLPNLIEFGTDATRLFCQTLCRRNVLALRLDDMENNTKPFNYVLGPIVSLVHC